MKNEYEWSEGGKQLLKLINKEIIDMGGIKPAYHILITENSPVYKHAHTAKKFFYCKKWMQRGDRRVKEKKFDYQRRLLTDIELTIINNNLDKSTQELKKLLPGRDADTLKRKRWELAKKLQIIKLLINN